MFKKLFIVMIAVLLVSGTAYGAVVSWPQPASENAVLQGGTGSRPSTPPTAIVRVRYALRVADAPTLSSGDVVVWDLNSADGVTISSCTGVNTLSYAGVLVTDILTADSSSNTGNERNWGYMAIQGFALAKIDTDFSVTGGSLTPNGSVSAGTFATVNGATGVSSDIGVLLTDSGTDGLMPVWLR